MIRNCFIISHPQATHIQPDGQNYADDAVHVKIFTNRKSIPLCDPRYEYIPRQPVECPGAKRQAAIGDAAVHNFEK